MTYFFTFIGPCLEYIFHAICCRITKLGLVIHHGMVQCRTQLLGHSDLLFGKPKEKYIFCTSSVNLSNGGWCIGRGHVLLFNTQLCLIRKMFKICFSSITAVSFYLYFQFFLHIVPNKGQA